MSEWLVSIIMASSGLGATTYGWGEMMCGDVGKARPCNEEAITASGTPLKDDLPIVALSMPTNRILRKAHTIKISLDGGKTCRRVLLADKKNERFAETKPWDLTPAALKKLGVEPTKHWSGEVTVCPH